MPLKLSTLLPPALVDAARQFLAKRNQAYGSVQEATRACGGMSYGDPELAEVVLRKTELSSARIEQELNQGATGECGLLCAVLAGFAACKNAVSVLDVGGACGMHYFQVHAALPDQTLRWCVVETAEMVSCGQRIKNTSLAFGQGLEWAREHLSNGVDLVHASGALQYFSDPFAIIRELSSLGARLMVFSRLPLTDSTQFTMVQRSKLSGNGPGPLPEGFQDRILVYPVTFISRLQFEASVSEDYRIVVRDWDAGGNYYTPRGRMLGRRYVLLRRT